MSWLPSSAEAKIVFNICLKNNCFDHKLGSPSTCIALHCPHDKSRDGDSPLLGYDSTAVASSLVPSPCTSLNRPSEYGPQDAPLNTASGRMGCSEVSSCSSTLCHEGLISLSVMICLKIGQSQLKNPLGMLELRHCG